MRRRTVITENMIILDTPPVSPLHGNYPEERSVEELLESGIIILDKPKGPTSHQVVAWVKEILGVAKTGHSGTLDPNVSGVLVVGLNDGTKYLNALLEGPKEYVAILELSHTVPKKDIRRTVAEFRGKIYQTPPLHAAVVRRLRKREIYFSNILGISGKRMLFHVGCESGTYIRTLCEDLGRGMGVKGTMAALRRVGTAHFHESEAVNLHELKDARVFYEEGDGEDTGDDEETELRRILRPPEDILDLFPKIVIKDSAVDAICRGAPLTVPGIAAVDTNIYRSRDVALLSMKGEGVALARAKFNSKHIAGMTKGVAAVSTRVFMKPGTYPKGW